MGHHKRKDGRLELDAHGEVKVDERVLVLRALVYGDLDAAGVRFNFAFSSCSLRWRGYDIPLPPVGKGWGDLLYLDDDLRVQRDVRGDLLIATKR